MELAASSNFNLFSNQIFENSENLRIFAKINNNSKI